TTFAAPWIALFSNGEAPTRSKASAWLDAHRPLLSTRDHAFIAVVDAHNRGDTQNWFRLASGFREGSAHDPFALLEFAEAAYDMNYYAAADSALSELRQLSGWPAKLHGVPYLQIDTRHDLGNFEGALAIWRQLSDTALGDPRVCSYAVLQLSGAG